MLAGSLHIEGASPGKFPYDDFSLETGAIVSIVLCRAWLVY